MPTPRERANGVVSAWSHEYPLALSPGCLERLSALIATAIDAQVADWMASLPAPVFRPELVAKKSHVVEAEAGKDYGHLTVSVIEPPVAAVCDHQMTRWDKENHHLICSACGREFKKGFCLHCGRPAVSDESFSCGKGCRG